MSKLFKISLEETIEEPVIEDPIENDTEEVSEAATKLAVEIEEMDNIAGQVVDVMQDVAKQVADNDDKLSDPDHVVTTIDVEVSEEALKRACYRLGEKPEIVLSFANEAIYNDIKNNARRYLVVSNEDLQDTLNNLTYKLNKLIQQVTARILAYIQQLIIKFGNFVGKFTSNVETLKKHQNDFLNNVKQETVDGIKDDLDKMDTAEARYALFNNGKVNVYYMHKDGAINGLKGIKDFCGAFLKITRNAIQTGNIGALKNFSGAAAMSAKTPVAEYGYKELPTLLIAPPSGNSGLTFTSGDLTSAVQAMFKLPKFKKVKLEKSDKQPNFNSDGVENLFKFLTANEVINEVKHVKENSNAMIREVKTTSDYAVKVLDEFKDKHNKLVNFDQTGFNIRMYLAALADVLKSTSLTANTYYVMAFFTTFKFIVRLSSILVKYTTGKETDNNQKLLTK